MRVMSMKQIQVFYFILVVIRTATNITQAQAAPIPRGQDAWLPHSAPCTLHPALCHTHTRDSTNTCRTNIWHFQQLSFWKWEKLDLKRLSNSLEVPSWFWDMVWLEPNLPGSKTSPSLYGLPISNNVLERSALDSLSAFHLGTEPL